MNSSHPGNSKEQENKEIEDKERPHGAVIARRNNINGVNCSCAAANPLSAAFVVHVFPSPPNPLSKNGEGAPGRSH